MDKKEILDKNKKQNRNSLDEREQKIYRLCHHQMFYEFAAIITAYLCTTFLYQYKNIRKTAYLIAGVLTGVAAALTAVLFFMVSA